MTKQFQTYTVLCETRKNLGILKGKVETLEEELTKSKTCIQENISLLDNEIARIKITQ